MADNETLESGDAGQVGGAENSAQESQQNVDSGQEQRSSQPERGTAAGSPSFDLAGFIEKHGLSELGDDPQVVLSQLVNRSRERDMYEQSARELAQTRALNEKLMRERELAREEANKAEQQPEKPWYSGKYDPLKKEQVWDDFLTTDPSTGERTFKQGTPNEVIQAYSHYERERAQRLVQLAENPGEFLNPLIETVEERMQRLIDERLNQNLSQRNEEYELSTFERDNAGWMWEADQHGSIRQVIDPNTGMYRPVPTTLGNRFIQLAYEAEQMGITNRLAKKDYAMRILRNEVEMMRMQYGGQPQTQQTQQTQQQPVETEEQRTERLANEQKDKALKAGRRLVQRNSGTERGAVTPSGHDRPERLHEMQRRWRAEREAELASS